ncbi:MAG: hypothetical protein ACR2QE_07500 [Acidimicrobiales bacterium]
MSVPESEQRGPADASEVDRLRAENAALREELAASAEPHVARWRRRWLSITLAVLGAILLPMAVLTVWARNTMLDTGQYVATVSPLADDPDIQEAVSFRITEAVAEAADFESLAAEALPDDAEVLALPIAAGAEVVINRIVQDVVATDAFKTVWEEANRISHENVVHVLTGQDDDLLQTSDGTVRLNFETLARDALVNLDDLLGTTLADSVSDETLDVEYVLIQSDDLADAQDTVRVFDNLAWLLPLLAIVLLIGVVLTAERRRLGARRLGLAIVISMVVTLLLLVFVRDQYLSGLPDDTHNPDAAAAVFDIVSRFVFRAVRALLVLGIAVLVGVWVTGPSSSAARVRTWWHTLLGRATDAGAERDLGPIPGWIAAHERALQFTAVGLAGLALVLWTRPTGVVVSFLVLIAALAVGAIRVLAEVGRHEADDKIAVDDRATPN